MKMRTRRKHAPWMHGGVAFRYQADWIWRQRFVKLQRKFERAFIAAFLRAVTNCWAKAYGRVDKENLAGGLNVH